MQELVFYETPALRHPVFLIALGGWPNAAEVGTGTLSYLRERLEAPRLGEIIPEDFYDFTSVRPLIVVEEGAIRWLQFPSNELYFWKNPQGEADLVMLLGVEPHLHWGKYLGLVLHIVRKFGVRRIYTVGGVYDRIPHTREPRVSAVVNFPRLKKELAPLGVSWTDYQGPCSFHSTLLATCKERKLEAVSLWGHAPIYVQAIKNPKVCHAVLRRLLPLLGMELDLEDLRQAGESLDATLTQLLGQSSELRHYVEKFEQEYEEQEREKHPGPVPGAQRILRELQEFLRQEQRKGGPGPLGPGG